ncbi:MAG: MmcQ/YjbR family DNA-binding protein [Acidimicrobiales bacterium]
MALPGAYERVSHDGLPSWRTKPRMFTWIRGKPEALVVWVESIEDKEALIASEPDKFFTSPHYDGYAIVLIRLDAVDEEEVAELITESWRLRAPTSLVKKWDSTHG